MVFMPSHRRALKSPDRSCLRRFLIAIPDGSFEGSNEAIAHSSGIQNVMLTRSP